MIRITLLEDFGAPVELKWGHEVVVPMSFGPATPEVTMEFSGSRNHFPARPIIWTLDWKDEETRSVVMQDHGPAVHYFGDPRSAGFESPLVRDKQIPNFNDERIRVAMAWGDYIYSDKYGPYTSVRIRMPQIPKVVIYQANANGTAIIDSAFFPHQFFRFEELLAPDHEAQWAEFLSRNRGGAFDPSNLSDSQLDAFIDAMQRRRKVKVENGAR